MIRSYQHLSTRFHVLLTLLQVDWLLCTTLLTAADDEHNPDYSSSAASAASADEGLSQITKLLSGDLGAVTECVVAFGDIDDVFGTGGCLMKLKVSTNETLHAKQTHVTPLNVMSTWRCYSRCQQFQRC